MKSHFIKIKLLFGHFGLARIPRDEPILVQDRGGTAALEFVMLAPVMLIMLFGFIATSTAIYAWTAMQSNAQSAAMMVSTGQVSSFNGTAVSCSSTLNSSQAEYWACQNLPSWASYQATVTESCGTTPQTVTVSLQVAAGSNAGLADTFGYLNGNALPTKAILVKQGTCP